MGDRRSFLSGLVSLPLIGGGVTLIGRPAEAIPLTQAAALPHLGSPRERAKYAWEAFSAAMRDLTIGHHGWTAFGCETVGYGYVPEKAFLQMQAVDYVGDRMGCISERNGEVEL